MLPQKSLAGVRIWECMIFREHRYGHADHPVPKLLNIGLLLTELAIGIVFVFCEFTFRFENFQDQCLYMFAVFWFPGKQLE